MLSASRDRYLLVRGPMTALSIALPAYGRITIGRAVGCDVIVEEEGVSDEAVVLYVDKGIEAEIGERSVEMTAGAPLSVGPIEVEIAIVTPDAPKARIFSSAFLAKRLGDDLGAVLILEPAEGTQAMELALERVLRPGEIAGPLGGAEWAILLPATIDDPGARAQEIAALLREVASIGSAIRGQSSLPLVEEARRRMSSARVDRDSAIPSIVAEDPRMKEVLRAAEQASASDDPLLILGETGTGKDLVAELVHRASRARQGRPLVRIAGVDLDDALTEATSAAQRAGQGTILFDEIGGLSARAQLALVRFVEQTKSVRLVFTSNHDLLAESKAGTFRKDLFFRIHKGAIEIPPLRERKSDITALAHRFAKGAPISPEAERALSMYNWPGNVRELEAAIAHALRASSNEKIEIEHLPEAISATEESEQPAPAAKPSPHASLREEMNALEKQRILEALERHGTQTEAAKALDIPLRTFLNRLDALGIRRVRKRTGPSDGDPE